MTIQTAPNIWKPHVGQQTRFLQSNAFEALFGGAASPGKTDCLLMESLRQIDNPRYNAILFRRVFPSLEAADGLIARSERWFTAYGGNYNRTKHYWTFPSGARVYFGHMQYEHDCLQYQGAQFTYIAFDELTEFTQKQYIYLFSRCRADPDTGLRCYVRSATNPGNIGHQWVKRRFVTCDIVNRKRYFATVNDVDTEVDNTHPDAYTRAFYPATMADNPNSDPEYRKRIMLNPDPVERARLLDGDWDAEDVTGRIYPTFSYQNITNEAEYNPELPIIMGIDDGYTEGDGVGSATYHPRVILLAQVTNIGGLNVFAEYVTTGELPEVTLLEVLKHYPKPQAAYIDSSAKDVQIVVAKHSIMAIAATHTVSEGIKLVRRLLCDVNNVRLLKIHPRCTALVREMQLYRKDERLRGVVAGEPPPLKVDDHCCDAVRYLARHFAYR